MNVIATAQNLKEQMVPIATKDSPLSAFLVFSMMLYLCFNIYAVKYPSYACPGNHNFSPFRIILWNLYIIAKLF